MTREEIIDGLEVYTIGRLKKARVDITVEELQRFIDAIKALEQLELCEDAVSREAAIDAIISFFKLTDYNESAYAVRTVLGDLPPVTPKQRTGKWIKITNTLYKCDQCGAVQLKGNYCKDCGAKMEGVNNEKVNIQRT